MANPRAALSSYGLPLPPPGATITGPRASRMAGRTAVPFPGVKRGRQKTTEHETANPGEVMTLIAAYARARRTVILTYRKITEHNQIVTREVEPYSIRTKQGLGGAKTYFYGRCLSHQEIHSFLVGNIVSVRGTSRSFVPRWKIEF